MSVPSVEIKECFCFLQHSLILRLRRFLLTALLNIFLGTEIMIRFVSAPVLVIYRNLSPGTLPCFPLLRSFPIEVLPQSFSFFGKVLGVFESNVSSLTDISQEPSLLKVLQELGQKFQLKGQPLPLQSQ